VLSSRMLKIVEPDEGSKNWSLAMREAIAIANRLDDLRGLRALLSRLLSSGRSEAVAADLMKLVVTERLLEELDEAEANARKLLELLERTRASALELADARDSYG